MRVRGGSFSPNPINMIRPLRIGDLHFLAQAALEIERGRIGAFSGDFLSKTRLATENLLIIENKLGDYSRVLNAYRKIDALKMSWLAALFFSIMHKPMELNLLSNRPSHFIFNIYKLSYFCRLKKNT